MRNEKIMAVDLDNSFEGLPSKPEQRKGWYLEKL